MSVHVAAEEPIGEAVVAALSDVDVEVRRGSPADVADARLGVVAGGAGGEALTTANEAALDGGTPWIAVEVGGVGGRPLPDVEAAISGFAPAVGCYDCLRARVDATTTEVAEEATAPRSAARLAGAVAGRECVRVLGGEGPSILGHVRELPHARRRVLPVPGCGCGDARDRTLGRDADSLALEDAVASAEAAIDDRVGIVTEIGEVESFPAPYYLARTADTAGFSDASAPEAAAGVAVDWNGALMKAVGEALERYCAGVYRDSDFVHASAAELADAVGPAELVRPADAPTVDPDEERRWVDAENLATGEPAHLPAAAVHFPQPGERIVPAITTGLGLGSSTVDALLSGLTEVVERDATMLSWYSTYEPLGLAVEDDGFAALARRARSEGLSVTPMLVTVDVDVPVVAAAVHRPLDADDPEWPAFALGSAADLDATAAARAATEEALQNWMELRSLGPEDADEAGGAVDEYASFPDRARSYVDVDGRVDAATVGPDPVPTGREALTAVVDRLEDAGLTPYAARLTTRDVEAVGFEAVRVVVPGAQPLFTGEAYFGERARTVPHGLGFEPRLDRAYHPFP